MSLSTKLKISWIKIEVMFWIQIYDFEKRKSENRHFSGIINFISKKYLAPLHQKIPGTLAPKNVIFEFSTQKISEEKFHSSFNITFFLLKIVCHSADDRNSYEIKTIPPLEQEQVWEIFVKGATSSSLNSALQSDESFSFIRSQYPRILDRFRIPW